MSFDEYERLWILRTAERLQACEIIARSGDTAGYGLYRDGTETPAQVALVEAEKAAYSAKVKLDALEVVAGICDFKVVVYQADWGVRLLGGSDR